MIIDKAEKRFWNRKKFKKVDEILKQEFKDYPNGVGTFRRVWARKKQLLKEMYNIDWRTPEELNPDIIFD